jgi:hypothetical protein
MPTSQDILQNLADIADQALPFAVVWHCVVLLALLMWALDFRLSRRIDAMLRCVPLASVGVVAWIYGNAFNGVVFALLAIAMGALSLQATTNPAAPVRNLERWFGAGLTAFGWLYPEFIDSAQPAYVFAYASPLGTLPCPTLSFLIGLQLLTGEPWGRLASRVLAVAGLFYGIWGVFRLGVWLDVALLLGALELLLATLPRRQKTVHAFSKPSSLATKTATRTVHV